MTTDRAEVDPTAAMFASGSVTEHVVRGILGLPLVVLSLAYADTSGWPRP